jgi:hypothetical protein
VEKFHNPLVAKRESASPMSETIKDVERKLAGIFKQKFIHCGD